MLKYSELTEQCRTNGWKTWCFPMEVGCRGYPGNSLWRAWKMLGIVGKERQEMVNEAGKRAESASMWIWRRRSERSTTCTDGALQPTRPVITDAQEGQVCNIWRSEQSTASTDGATQPTRPVITDAQGGQVCKVCRVAGHQTVARECPKRLPTPLENVTSFKGKYDVLSNYYPCNIDVLYDGLCISISKFTSQRTLS